MKHNRTFKKRYSNYAKYKQYIRIDFRYKCVYCHRHEGAFDSYREFEIDHIRPKSIERFTALSNDYNNLVYSCPHCNNMKTASWPSDDPVIDGAGWIDPCEHDFDDHYRIFYDGSGLNIVAYSPLGNWLIHNLGFDQKARIDNMARWYRRIHTLRRLVLYTHRQSKSDELSEQSRTDANRMSKDLLIELRALLTPEPYTPFERVKAS